MNPLRANFSELYERHLCRHSQYGINVIHFISLLGTYWALYGFALSLIGSIWPLLGLGALYAAILAFNVPVRVLLLSVLCLTLFFVALAALPVLPFYIYPLTIYPFYKLQAVSHRFYAKAYDMTYFNQKYPKSFSLFILLSTYELPLQLNALFLDRNRQPRSVPGQPVTTPAHVPEASPAAVLVGK
jgi:hypothetical protein